VPKELVGGHGERCAQRQRMDDRIEADQIVLSGLEKRKACMTLKPVGQGKQNIRA